MRLISFCWIPIQNICVFIKICVPDCRGYCMYVYKILHTRDMFPLPPVGEESQCVRVRSMYVNVCKYPRNCGQVTKKKMHRAAKVQISTSWSGPKYICGQRSKMVSQGYTHSCNFFAFYAQYGRSFFLPRWRLKANFQPVCKMTRYKDGGLLGEFFLTV
jgi:hypothetical protein